MEHKLAMLITLCLAGVVAAQGNTDKSAAKRSEVKKSASAEPTGKEILDRADRALRRVKLVKYKATFGGFGWMAERSPRVSGTVIQGGMSETGLDKYRVTGTVGPFDAPTSRELTVATDGYMHYLLNPATKTLHASTDPMVVGAGGAGLKAIVFPYFSHLSPLSFEMSMDRATLLRTVDVEGEKCYEVHLMNLADAQEAIWCFSVKDYLPRRRELIFEDLGEKATLTWTISEVEVDPKLEGNPFKLTLPEGYTKTDKKSE